MVDLLDSFLHYETDTEPGSSGSPVFNDQWEVVALHHASVAAPDHAELGSIMNEGIRVSTLVRAARDLARELPAPAAALLKACSTTSARPSGPLPPPLRRRRRHPGSWAPGCSRSPCPKPAAAAGETRITIPIEIVVRFGGPSAGTA